MYLCLRGGSSATFATLLRTMAISVAAIVSAGSVQAAERCPELMLEGGVFSGMPAALEVGHSLGGMLALSNGVGPFLYGGGVSVSESSEYSPSWRLSHVDTRVRGFVGVRAAAGRGTWIARLGGGITIVHEERVRHDSVAIGHTNVGANESNWAVLPALDLQGGLALNIYGAWGIALFVGPTVHFGDEVAWGFAGSAAIVWTP